MHLDQENLFSDAQPNALGRFVNDQRRATMAQSGIPISLIGGSQVTPEERAAAIANQPLNIIGQMAEADLDRFREEGFSPLSFKDIDSLVSALQFAAETIAASAPQMAATFASGAFAPFVQIGFLGGEVNEELAERTDLTSDQRVAISLGTGIVMTGFETFGLGKVFGGILPGNIAQEAIDGLLVERLRKNGLSAAAARTLQAGIIEGSTELIQEGLVVGVSALSGGRYSQDEVLDRLTAAFVSGGVVGAGLHGSIEGPAGSIRDFNRKFRGAQRAGNTADKLTRIDGVVGANLRKTSPETHRSVADVIFEGAGDILLPADKVLEHFQNQGLPSAVIAKWGVSEEAFQQKLSSGGMVHVSAADYATDIGGTPDAAFFKEHGRQHSDEMSAHEATAFNERIDVVLENVASDVKKAVRVEAVRRASDLKVRDDIVAQLSATGRDPQVASNEGLVWASFFRALANRTGDDAYELYLQYRPRIEARTEASLAQRRIELDHNLNRLRDASPGDTDPSLQDLRTRLDAMGVDLSTTTNEEAIQLLNDREPQFGEEIERLFQQSAQTPVEIDLDTKVRIVNIPTSTQQVRTFKEEKVRFLETGRGISVKEPGGREIQISGKSKKIFHAQMGNPIRLAVIRHLSELVANAPIYSHPKDREGRQHLSYAHAAGAVRVEGIVYPVRLVYRANDQGTTVVWQLIGYEVQPGSEPSVDTETASSQPIPDRFINLEDLLSSFKGRQLFQGPADPPKSGKDTVNTEGVRPDSISADTETASSLPMPDRTTNLRNQTERFKKEPPDTHNRPDVPIKIDPDTEVEIVQIDTSVAEVGSFVEERKQFQKAMQGRSLNAPDGTSVRLSSQARKAFSSNRGNPLKAVV
ncbi:MAG: hypothetical protein AAGE61_21910, partial [Pseudomonadota bacterium]